MITFLFAAFLTILEHIFSSNGSQPFSQGGFLNETLTSGFLPNYHGDELFYILLDSRDKPQTDPLVIWLTGGPGCSSELAMFTENGPFKINQEDLSLSLTPFAWNNQANLLYVDQPAGTGFSSIVNYHDTSEDDIAQDFYAFFLEFLNKYPQFKERDLFVTGESYAGHYIPVIATYMLNQNNSDINIKGIAIGNGWVDPLNQYPAYGTFAYSNNLINKSTYQTIENQFVACTQDLSDDEYSNAARDCTLPYHEIVGYPTAFNIYDIRLPCIGPICYNMSYVDRFLAQTEVQEALGVVGRSWSECNSQVRTYLNQDHEMGYASYVEDVLSQGIPVLIYSGVEDFTCNYMGGEAWTNALDYPGHSDFVNASYTTFNEFGEFKTVQGLTFFKVFEAGHLVPMDQPETSVSMLQAFIKGYFGSSETLVQ